MQHNSRESFINVVKWGTRHATIDFYDKEVIPPQIPLKASYKLFFGDKSNEDQTKGIVEPHSHNECTRVTIIYRNHASFTFELKKGTALERKATYNVNIGKKEGSRALISFEEKGKKFSGTGKDHNNKDFKINGSIKEPKSV